MRIKSNWFKSGRKRTLPEIAGALAFVIWRIGDNALKNTRNAKFEIAIGTQYFSFLSEFLVFLIQVADRIAYRQLPAEDRLAFTSALANRVAETLAENQSRLIGNSIENTSSTSSTSLTSARENMPTSTMTTMALNLHSPATLASACAKLWMKGCHLGDRPDDGHRSSGGRYHGGKNPARLIRNRTETATQPQNCQRGLNSTGFCLPIDAKSIQSRQS